MNVVTCRCLSVCLLPCVLAACGAVRDEAALRFAFETAEPGDVIEIAAGTMTVSRSLTLNTDRVTLRGAGLHKTILDFAGQAQGAEGILVNASDFTIEDLTIQDTIGDALKINQGRNAVVRRVRTQWTGGPKTENGAYGIYPVQIDGVLIEDSIAIAASDAGIYVGQSKNIIVRNNFAEYNVAGIEIENSQDADVYSNRTVNNTGGILVFNMPHLSEVGMRTRVFDNDISENNTANFGREGTAVAEVPSGTGLLINANDQVEVFDNRFSNNRTAHVLIASSYDEFAGVAERFDPYPETLFFYENFYTGGGDAPDMVELEALRMAMFGDDGRLPSIVWDGVVHPDRAEEGALPAELAICLGEPADTEFLNIDMSGSFAKASVDASAHLCEHAKLGAARASAG